MRLAHRLRGTSLLPAFLLTVPIVALVGLAACDGSPPPASAGDDVGSVVLALSTVPSDVRCIEVTVTAPSRTVTRRFDVTPGQSAALTVSGLPVGPATVDERTFAVACSGVGTTTIPTWEADAVAPVTLVAGAPATGVTLVLRRPAQIQITNDFENGPPPVRG